MGALTSELIPVETCEDRGLITSTGSTASTTVLYIQTLAVYKDHQRKGVATRLIKEAVSFAQSKESCGGVYLHVLATNSAAINFYKLNNFANIRRCKEYYRIQDKLCDSLLFIHYCNGTSAPRRTWREWLSRYGYEITFCHRSLIDNFIHTHALTHVLSQ